MGPGSSKANLGNKKKRKKAALVLYSLLLNWQPVVLDATSGLTQAILGKPCYHLIICSLDSD